MAKVFKEEQRFHEPLSNVLFVVLALAAIYNIVQQLVYQGWNEGTSYAVAGLLILGAIYFVVRSLRMHTKIGRKKLRVQVRPLPWSSREVHRDEVESIHFFRMSEAALSGGWAVGVSPSLYNYNFGDRSGIVFLLKSGEEIRIFSSKLYRNADELTEEMQALGWPVEYEATAR